MQSILKFNELEYSYVQFCRNGMYYTNYYQSNQYIPHTQLWKYSDKQHDIYFRNRWINKKQT